MRIFLTGFPGSGKTYLGKLWAEDNGLFFYDLDTLIEEEERMRIDKIFAEYGEDYFREKEAAVLRNTDRFDNCIIACGGGTPCFFDNAAWMKKNGILVFLNETSENLFHHLVNDKKDRPLVPKTAVELQQYIKEKPADRLTFYRESHITINPENLNRNGFHFITQYLKHA
jgi:shikimate kinase